MSFEFLTLVKILRNSKCKPVLKPMLTFLMLSLMHLQQTLYYVLMFWLIAVLQKMFCDRWHGHFMFKYGPLIDTGQCYTD